MSGFVGFGLFWVVNGGASFVLRFFYVRFSVVVWIHVLEFIFRLWLRSCLFPLCLSPVPSLRCSSSSSVFHSGWVFAFFKIKHSNNLPFEMFSSDIKQSCYRCFLNNKTKEKIGLQSFSRTSSLHLTSSSKAADKFLKSLLKSQLPPLLCNNQPSLFTVRLSLSLATRWRWRLTYIQKLWQSLILFNLCYSVRNIYY